jgi:2-oxoglutarate ferredoxin oxidoreductase subunit alpha
MTHLGNQEIAWRIGGPQGSGVDTAARIFSLACAYGGLHVFGRREYYSNIMGRHSYYDVRVASHSLTSHTDRVDLLAAFEAETLARHTICVRAGGVVIYNTDDEDTPFERIPFLGDQIRQNLIDYLDEQGLPATLGGLLEDARGRGVHTLAFPYNTLIDSLAGKLGVPKSIAGRALNTIAVAGSLAALGYDPGPLVKALEKTFPDRPKIVDMNLQAADLTYEFVRDEFDTGEIEVRLKAHELSERRLLVNGNQATAMGKLAGGMMFQTYYPISPATDESVYLESHSTYPIRDGGGEECSIAVVQTEDELAAVTMATGAALTGARSATATSGPGFSLMVEGLGWAGMNEVPLVVTLYQRGGPGTGLPTRTEQGDLLFAIRAGHGEFPRLVLASGDVNEAFYDAAQAFNYAERYQMPVIHLLDKALASTTQTVRPFDTDSVRVERGDVYAPPPDGNGAGPYPRFAMTESGVSPRSLLGQPGGNHWLTGGEHTVHGLVTEDAVVREQMVEKRARKLELAAREIPQDEKFRVYGDPDAALTILSWGSNKGAILEAMGRLEADGVGARLVQVRLLWPFPAEELSPWLETAAPLVVVETNFSGQLAQLLRERTGRVAHHLLVKYNGRPIPGEALHQALTTIVAGDGEARMVIRNPYE